ncbi:MAG: hypothetical protein H0U13_07360, partial [Gemmatimonadaceae bacterium]|nr:hypothetical protein [Gemmatimonadaceae bacterium]
MSISTRPRKIALVCLMAAAVSACQDSLAPTEATSGQFTLSTRSMARGEENRRTIPNQYIVVFKDVAGEDTRARATRM